MAPRHAVELDVSHTHGIRALSLTCRAAAYTHTLEESDDSSENRNDLDAWCRHVGAEISVSSVLSVSELLP